MSIEAVVLMKLNILSSVFDSYFLTDSFRKK